VISELAIDMWDGNVKLDVVEVKGGPMMMLPGSADLQNGIGKVALLGVADLDLAGTKGRNVLLVNDGDNRLDGGGNDKLIRGGGADTFGFSAGRDRIRDFQDNRDTIAIDADLLDVDESGIRDLMDHGGSRMAMRSLLSMVITC
jgi:Ca2+-binding RTX toxin-like protein